jgi:nucleoside-diphosphate-sugar epimerase
MRRILITGGSGLLGSNLARMAVGRYEVHATYNKNTVSMNGVDYFYVDI